MKAKLKRKEKSINQSNKQTDKKNTYHLRLVSDKTSVHVPYRNSRALRQCYAVPCPTSSRRWSSFYRTGQF